MTLTQSSLRCWNLSLTKGHCQLRPLLLQEARLLSCQVLSKSVCFIPTGSKTVTLATNQSTTKEPFRAEDSMVFYVRCSELKALQGLSDLGQHSFEATHLLPLPPAAGFRPRPRDADAADSGRAGRGPGTEASDAAAEAEARLCWPRPRPLARALGFAAGTPAATAAASAASSSSMSVETFSLGPSAIMPAKRTSGMGAAAMETK